MVTVVVMRLFQPGWREALAAVAVYLFCGMVAVLVAGLAAATFEQWKAIGFVVATATWTAVVLWLGAIRQRTLLQLWIAASAGGAEAAALEDQSLASFGVVALTIASGLLVWRYLGEVDGTDREGPLKETTGLTGTSGRATT